MGRPTISMLATALLAAACWRVAPPAGVDTDAGTDADIDTDFCLDGEVLQPGTELCWLRCPLGQTLNGSVCNGTKIWANWCGASGSDVSCLRPGP